MTESQERGLQLASAKPATETSLWQVCSLLLLLLQCSPFPRHLLGLLLAPTPAWIHRVISSILTLLLRTGLKPALVQQCTAN